MGNPIQYLDGFEPEKHADDMASPITLPNKATCTVAEASQCTGISQRQIRYWIEDGTLLAVNSAREPISKRRSFTKYDRWRIVVRRSPEMSGEEAKAFYTLAELLPRITNQIAE